MIHDALELRGPATPEMGMAGPKPIRATLIGLLVGTALAIIAALGPLVSAITITVGVETQVGEASSLPDARMLPAALEGVGAVAVIFLLARRPAGRLRAWCLALIFVSLGAGMAAQGTHAIWYDQRQHQLELPWRVRLLVSFVPPVSGLATLHLVVKMAEDVIGTIRLLSLSEWRETSSLDGEEPDRNLRGSSQTSSPDGLSAPWQAKANLDLRVLRILRANPHATWKVVRDRTGLTDANAKRALTAARKKLRTRSQEASAAEEA
jgi:hypothetical protein